MAPDLSDYSVHPRKETIGDTKVTISESHVDVIKFAKGIVEAKRLKKDDSAFTIVNLDALAERVELWNQELPNVQPFYAIKCNNDEVLLRVLAAQGVNFDCASAGEIKQVLRVGVAPERIIYAHPCKSASSIEYAEAEGVKMMTFDSVEELQKIAEHHKNARLILRFAVSDPTASHPLNRKFGADPEKTAMILLKRAAQMGMDIFGVSFHVGSGCNDPTTYEVALQHARRLVDAGLAFGHTMEIVDIGGGFPGSYYQPRFEKYAAVIRSAIDDYFPEPRVRIVAEPGRFFAEAPFTLVTNVIARVAVDAVEITKNAGDVGSTGYFYYINDGVYGSFSYILVDKERPTGQPLFEKKGELFHSTIWGQTADSADLIEDNRLMRAVDVGDWLIYENMGAYTTVCATNFNGFHRPDSIYVIGNRTWASLEL